MFLERRKVVDRISEKKIRKFCHPFFCRPTKSLKLFSYHLKDPVKHDEKPVEPQNYA